MEKSSDQRSMNKKLKEIPTKGKMIIETPMEDKGKGAVGQTKIEKT